MSACTWCGRDPHAGACPRTILVAASAVGEPLPRRWADKTTASDCPCVRRAA
mgnify:CR=1 FL=1